MKSWRELPLRRRVLILIACLPFLDLLFCWIIAPQSWNWTGGNLQVHLYNEANRRAHQGSYGCSAGFSKLGIAIGDWWRDLGPSFSEGGGTIIRDESHFSIAGVSPSGVSVRVRYHQDINGQTVSFDRVIFVPAHRAARLDISPDLYVTGQFE